jgi:hypothetical protein
VEAVAALRFARVARRLGSVAHAAGLAVPAFRSPPRLPEARRTIRRYPGGAVVSVRMQGRPFDDVVADMVEGMLVANRLCGEGAGHLRTLLRDAVMGDAAPEAA